MAVPSKKTPEIINEILTRLAAGEPLKYICESDRSRFPAQSTFCDWVDADPELSEMYARARERQADAGFDEIQSIADRSSPETWQVDRLRIDTMKWRLSKMLPKKYGDKIIQEHTGSDGGPLSITIKPAIDREVKEIEAVEIKEIDG